MASLAEIVLGAIKTPLVNADPQNRKDHLRGRSKFYNALDNVIGFDDDRVTTGELLGQSLRSDPGGTIGALLSGAADGMQDAYQVAANPSSDPGAAGLAAMGLAGGPASPSIAARAVGGVDSNLVSALTSGGKPVKAPFDVGSGGATASMYDAPAGSDPRYVGAAPNRNDISFLRYRPKKNTARVDAALSALRDPQNPVRQMMMKDIQTGQGVGRDWYNTEELRDWFVSELGPEEGHRQWSEYIDLIGAASPGSKVPANIKNATAIRQRLYDQTPLEGQNMTYAEALGDVQKLDEARPFGKSRVPGYGHKTQGLQELITARQLRGEWDGSPEPGVPASQGNWADNPKPKGFSQSLKGSGRNIAADLHFTRYMAMASGDPDFLSTGAVIGNDAAKALVAQNPKLKNYIKPAKNGDLTFAAKRAANDGEFDMSMAHDYPTMWAEKPRDAEYAAFEDFVGELGDELGMTAPQVQAALWMGAADRTGVDVTSQKTFMEAVRAVADERAAKEGLSREEVMRRFIRERGLLSAPMAPAPMMPSQEDDNI